MILINFIEPTLGSNEPYFAAKRVHRYIVSK